MYTPEKDFGNYFSHGGGAPVHLAKHLLIRRNVIFVYPKILLPIYSPQKQISFAQPHQDIQLCRQESAGTWKGGAGMNKPNDDNDDDGI